MLREINPCATANDHPLRIFKNLDGCDGFERVDPELAHPDHITSQVYFLNKRIGHVSAREVQVAIAASCKHAAVLGLGFIGTF